MPLRFSSLANNDSALSESVHPTRQPGGHSMSPALTVRFTRSSPFQSTNVSVTDAARTASNKVDSGHRLRIAQSQEHDLRRLALD